MKTREWPYLNMWGTEPGNDAGEGDLSAGGGRTSRRGLEGAAQADTERGWNSICTSLGCGWVGSHSCGFMQQRNESVSRNESIVGAVTSSELACVCVPSRPTRK